MPARRLKKEAFTHWVKADQEIIGHIANPKKNKDDVWEGYLRCFPWNEKKGKHIPIEEEEQVALLTILDPSMEIVLKTTT